MKEHLLFLQRKYSLWINCYICRCGINEYTCTCTCTCIYRCGINEYTCTCTCTYRCGINEYTCTCTYTYRWSEKESLNPTVCALANNV